MSVKEKLENQSRPREKEKKAQSNVRFEIRSVPRSTDLTKTGSSDFPKQF